MKNIITDRLIIESLIKMIGRICMNICQMKVVKYEPYDIYSEDQAKEEAAKGQMTVFLCSLLKGKWKVNR